MQVITCNGRLSTECYLDDVLDSSIQTNVNGMWDVKMSHNGDYLFASVRSDNDPNLTGKASANRIIVWAYDVETDALTFVQEVVGGVNTDTYALEDVGYLAISPDSTFLVAASYEEDALALFTFDPLTGELAFDSALYDLKSPNAGGTVHGLDGVTNMVFHDESDTDPTKTKKIFTACDDGSEIGVFEVSPTLGLNFLAVRRTQRAGQDDLPGCLGADSGILKMRNPQYMAVDAVNGFLYVAFTGNDVLGVFNILDESPYLECNHQINIDAVYEPHQVVLGDAVWVGYIDGYVYVIGGRLAIISVFEQDNSPTAIYGNGTLDLIQQENETSCPDLLKPIFGAISADGCLFYVAQIRGDPVMMFSRDHDTGELTFLSVLLEARGSSWEGATSVALHPYGDVFVPYLMLNETGAYTTELQIYKDVCPDISFTLSNYDELEAKHHPLEDEMLTVPNTFAAVLSGLLFASLVVGLYSSTVSFFKKSAESEGPVPNFDDVESHWSSKSYSAHSYTPVPTGSRKGVAATLGEVSSLTGAAEGSNYQSQEEMPPRFDHESI